MKETGIIFSGTMALANIEGRKKQTRRTRGLEKINVCPDAWGYQGISHDGDHAFYSEKARPHHEFIKCPYGGPGDLIWQRETWWEPPFITHKMMRDGADTWPDFVYDASEDDYTREEWSEWGWKKKPSIYMPRRASRFKAKLISVRPERVQDITDGDCELEGVRPSVDGKGGEDWRDDENGWHRTFRHIWDSINAQKGLGWDVNPWVWRLEYEEVKR